jgi:hypothetical protein
MMILLKQPTPQIHQQAMCKTPQDRFNFMVSILTPKELLLMPRKPQMFGAQALARDITLWNKWNKRLKD